ncbi:MAG: hypothetical protein ABIJ17_01535 [Patescibacteria group bacterium]
MQNKTKDRLKELYKEYQDKYDEIIKKYGEKDGFIINGISWWDYYGNLINKELEKIKNNTFTEKNALNFYKKFGFGPKLYPNSFLENGLERIKKVILYLADPDISIKMKLSNVAENKMNKFFLKGVGKNFVTLFLVSRFPKKYGQWNKPIDSVLKELNIYPKRAKNEPDSWFYIKINSTLLEIKEVLFVESLAIIDNLLYCINKKYIGVVDKRAGILKKKEIFSGINTRKISHWDAIAILVELGKILGFETYVADPNKETQIFNTKLKLLAKSTKELPDEFVNVKNIQRVDVIWLPPRGSYEKSHFFEVEDKGTMREALHRLYGIMMFEADLFIVGPKKNKVKFEKWAETAPFNTVRFRNKCQYRNYKELVQLFEKAKDYFKTKEEFFN